MPQVSVVLPVFNRSRFLQPTLESIQAQSLADLELIVVDDGSTDDTTEVVERAAADDGRIRVVRQANAGAAEARRRGLAQATGEFVALIDHDDRWLPEKLRLQVEALSADSSLGWVYGRCMLVGDEGSPLGEFADLYGYPKWEGWIYRRLLLHQNFIGTYSLPLFRRSVLAQAGDPWAGAGVSDDWDLFLRVAEIAPIGFVDEVLLEYNAGNPGSQSRTNLERAYRCEEAVMRRHADSVRRLSLRDRWELRRRLGKRWSFWMKEHGTQAHRRGDFQVASRSYARAAILNPALLFSTTFLKDALVVQPMWRMLRGVRAR